MAFKMRNNPLRGFFKSNKKSSAWKKGDVSPPETRARVKEEQRIAGEKEQDKLTMGD